MKQLGFLAIGLALTVASIVYAERRFLPRSAPDTGEPGLAGSLARIESIGDLSNPGVIGSALALQFGPALETRGRALIGDKAREGRFLRYQLIANHNPQIDDRTLTYTVFVADGKPSGTSSQLDSFTRGCPRQVEFERALGQLAQLPPDAGLWGTVLVKMPAASDGVRIKLDIQRGCLGRMQLSQETLSE